MKTGSKVAAGLMLACVQAAGTVSWGALTPGQAIPLSSDRLVANQTGTGNWPDQDVDFTGPIIAGLGNAYLVTGASVYRNSTLSGANYILSAASGNFLGDEAYGLTIASQLSVNPLSNPYRGAVNTFYKTTIPNLSGGTAGYISNLINTYTQTFQEQSQATLYVAEHTVAAAYVNAPDLATWRASLISVLSQVDDTDFFPIQATGVALWALAKTGPLDATLITSSSASSFWSGKTLADLPALVASRQITSGTDAGGYFASFGTNTGGFTEDAVYATLGLSVADPAAYRAQVLSAKNWIANSVNPSGADQGMLPDNPSSPTQVLNAYTGEGLQAMTAPFAAVWDNSTGNWSEASRWSLNPSVPDNDLSTGIFYDVTVNGGTVNLDSNRTIRVLTMNGGTLTGSANLRLSGGVINGTYVVTGTTTIVAGTLMFGGTVQTAGPITGGGNLLLNAGTTLISDGITVPTLIINGNVQIRPNGTVTGTSKVNSLTIAHTGAGTSSDYTATLNLADNALVVQAVDASDKSVKVASLVEAINKGANGGLWNGLGITSSTAAVNSTSLGVGVFDNGVLGKTSIGGVSADANSLLVAVAHLGDANRNGVVDIQDQALVTNHWQSTQNNWAAGDMNLDGFVDIQDLTIINNNWQQTSAFAQRAGALAAGAGGAAPVPEPASGLVLGVSAVMVLCRVGGRKRRLI